MKRLLVVFLLLGVPFQITWAAAGAYCRHETGATPQHFGHHAHQHRTVASDDSKDSPTVKLHPDCGYCYLGGAGIVPDALALPSAPATATNGATDPGFLASIFLERLERPKWASRLA